VSFLENFVKQSLLPNFGVETKRYFEKRSKNASQRMRMCETDRSIWNVILKFAIKHYNKKEG